MSRSSGSQRNDVDDAGNVIGGDSDHQHKSAASSDMPGPSNSKRKKKANNKAKGKKRVEAPTVASANITASAKSTILSGRLSPEQLRGRPLAKPTRTTTNTPKVAPKGPRSHIQPSNANDDAYGGIICDVDDSDSSYPSSSPLITPPPTNVLDYQFEEYAKPFHESEMHKFSPKERIVPEERLGEIERALNKPPFIHDPGNGPRVRDAKEFMESEFFSQPPAYDDPLCAEFAQPEMLQMLQTVLPDEIARILWYNKSRATGRICPVCQRLYRLGDVLPEHAGDDGAAPQRSPQPKPHQLQREQQISGCCSGVCFVLASYTFPFAVKGSWGKLAEEIDDATWELLNAPDDVKPRYPNDTSAALGMIVRMTRLHDLGLAQLCFGLEENAASRSESDSSEPTPS